ncbi:MAG: hypothetical protein ABFD92_12220 [Planctomycetaceae bacterium]|nr:hypothetical protein [Planctomycetaceae bacterium]
MDGSDILGDVDSLGLDRQEAALVSLLDSTSREIAHSECLESEERAEVYTILEIIKSDTRRHRQMVGRYVSDGGRGNA